MNTDAIIENIHHIESGTSFSRSLAMARLLDSCKRDPYYIIDDQRYSLSVDLDARIATAAITWRETYPDGFARDFVDAVLVHYDGRPKEETVFPTPMSIVRNLQRIANLCDNNGVASMRIMTAIHIGWIGSVDECAQIHAIEHFWQNPVGNDWVAFAIQREAKHLTIGARECAFKAYFDIRRRTPNHIVVPFATSILGDLATHEANTLLELAARSEPAWRAFVVDMVVDAAERVKNVEVWTDAVVQLLTWAEDATLDDQARLRAMSFGFGRIGARRLLSQRLARHLRENRQPPDEQATKWIALCDDLLNRIATTSTSPPFAEHREIQAELRRLGLRP